MGTSQSSNGPLGGVPMVPSWVPDPPDGEMPDGGAPPPADGATDGPSDGQPAPSPPTPVPYAPTGRFGPARLNLGNFARTGEADSMRRGVGHYVRKGYGGAGTSVRVRAL